MNAPEPLHQPPLARAESSTRPPEQLWSIVLAGGEGARLRPLTRQICADERPKQYAPLMARRSLLRQTLDRVARAVLPEQTVVVSRTSHARYLAAELVDRPTPRLLLQPTDRGTAAGVLFPAHWIHWRDPEATVVVFPSDHFILEELVFIRHVRRVVAFVAGHPQWLVLLGARPSEPEPGYGWIEPGDPIGPPAGSLICRVRRFWEKPPDATARACFSAGALWNTFVFVSKVATLLEAGRQFLPDLSDRLARIAPFVNTEDERWAVQQAYALAPNANFSEAVLEQCPPFLAVSRLPRLTWCDLGTPTRILDSLAKSHIQPPWDAQAGDS